MVGLRGLRLMVALVATTFFIHGATSLAQSPGAPPAGKSYIIEMTNSQVASGFANDLVPPLVAAIDATGLKRTDGARADYVISISHNYDVGKWHYGTLCQKGIVLGSHTATSFRKVLTP